MALSLYKIARAFGFFACLVALQIPKHHRPMKTWTISYVFNKHASYKLLIGTKFKGFMYSMPEQKNDWVSI